MAHDVFISYALEDKTVADAACATLENRNFRCWIAPRDVPAGQSKTSAIVNAISDSQVLVLIFSSGSNKSGQVVREVGEAIDNGIPVIPLRIEDVELSSEMRYYIKSIHWLDAITPPLERHLDKLAQSVEVLLSVDSQPKPTVEPSLMVRDAQKLPKFPNWAKYLIVGAGLLILGGLGGWIASLSQRAGPPEPDSTIIAGSSIEDEAEVATNVASTPTLIPSPTAVMPTEQKIHPLEISFNPNPVTAVQDGEYWMWWFTYSVYNPNDFPVEIEVFGGFNECLSDSSDCSFSTGDFFSWFIGCGEGSREVPARGTACDKEWWVRWDSDPGQNVLGRFAVYFFDQEGIVHRSISEEITLLRP